MRCIHLFLLLCSIAISHACDALEAVYQAQALLGPDTWSKVVQIENRRPSENGYPETVHALIFEFAGILWFYTPHNGTQSFSLYKNRLEREKRDLRPGIQAIAADFVSFVEIQAREGRLGSAEALPNGCFITSVIAGWRQYARGEPILRAQLLMFHVRDKREGHCIFVYETPRGVYAIDSEENEGRPQRVSGRLFENPKSLVAAVAPEARGGRLTGVRTLAFPVPPAGSARTLLASNERTGRAESRASYN